MKQKINILALCTQITLVLVLSSLFYSHTLEDAFITFRYSKHLAEGYGFGAWNTDGSKVEGYTTWLWMVLSALWQLIGLSQIQVAKTIGILSVVGIVLCLRYLSILAPFLCKNEKNLGLAASWWISLSLPVSYYATTGMETTFFAFLSLLLLISAFSKSSQLFYLQWPFIVLLILLRPEGIFVSLAVYTFKLFAPSGLHNNKTTAIFALSLSILSYIALIMSRYSVFGYYLPNTYYAKVDGGEDHWKLGIKYLYNYYQADPMILLLLTGALLVLWGIVNRKTAIVSTNSFLGTFIILYLFYIAKVGGDNPSAFNYWRHLIHIVPFLALAIDSAMSELGIRPRLRSLLFIVGAILFNFNVYYMKGHINNYLKDILDQKRSVSFRAPKPNSFEKWLTTTFPKDTVLATSRAGQLPFFVDFPVIDILGLNNEHIAHHGAFQKGVIDSKTDMKYVLNQRPGLIESTIKHAHIADDKIISKPQSYWRKMEDELIESEVFQQEYLFIKNLPTSGRALFIHKKLYDSLNSEKDLGAIPVLETSIYKSR